MLTSRKPLRRTPLKCGTSQLKRTRLKTRKPLGVKLRPKRGAKIDYSLLGIPKSAKRVPALWEFEDGRVIYNRQHPQGAHLYESAKNLMADRQGWLCSICGEPMRQDELSFEHGNLRVAGKRNDDPNAVDPDGYFWNSAAHGSCNGRKGSRRDYPLAIRLKPEAKQ